jgi:hypothetical protein
MKALASPLFPQRQHPSRLELRQPRYPSIAGLGGARRPRRLRRHAVQRRRASSLVPTPTAEREAMVVLDGRKGRPCPLGQRGRPHPATLDASKVTVSHLTGKGIFRG